MATIIVIALANIFSGSIEYNRAEAQVIYQPKDALDYWLDDLAEYESTGLDDTKKHLDVNGKYSYDCLQFQMQTYVSQAKHFDMLPPGDPEETIKDCNLQKKIARAMIEEDYSAWRNWYTSVIVRGLGKPPKEM